MFDKLKGLLFKKPRSSHAFPVDPKLVAQIVSDAGAAPWHTYVMTEREARKDVCVACDWIVANCDSEKHLYEAGCGCGQNLIWLGTQGFTNLHGSDISKEALQAGHVLAKTLGLNLDLHIDNIMNLECFPEQVEVFFALNMLYYVPGLRLETVLSQVALRLSHAGVMLFDVVDSSYNTINDNQYHTQDWGKPEKERRPSEYAFRISENDVREIAKLIDCKVVAVLDGTEMPPRKIYVLQLS